MNLLVRTPAGASPIFSAVVWLLAITSHTFSVYTPLQSDRDLRNVSVILFLQQERPARPANIKVL